MGTPMYYLHNFGKEDELKGAAKGANDENVIENVIRIGLEENMAVGRMKVNENTLVSGWVKDGQIHVPYDGKEHTSSTYELLTVTKNTDPLYWWDDTVKINGEIPPGAVVAAHENEQSVYVIRVKREEEFYVGRLYNGVGYISIKDREEKLDDGEISVLCVDSEANVEWLDTSSGWTPGVEGNTGFGWVKLGESQWLGMFDVVDTSTTLPGIVKDREIHAVSNNKMISSKTYQLLRVTK